MKLPLLTLAKYQGIERTSPSRPSLWLKDRTWAKKPVLNFERENAIKSVANLLAAKPQAETITEVYHLDNKDRALLGNQAYQIISSSGPDAPTKTYFLKQLGSHDHNRREIYVWQALGYGDQGIRARADWFLGLPSEVFVNSRFNYVLMPFFPGSLSLEPGNPYEFPLVLSAFHHIALLLAELHKRDLIYMDVNPDNILYQYKPERVLFFLTDMGSVKLLRKDKPHPAWDELSKTITKQRLTRNSTKPPANLFPDPESIVESDSNYDYFTLAQTCSLLLGLGSKLEPDSYPIQLSWEDPLSPLRSEIESFAALLEQVKGHGYLPFQAKLLDLFESFFSKRFSHFQQLGRCELSDLVIRHLRARWRSLRPLPLRSSGQAVEDLGNQETQPNPSFSEELKALEEIPGLLIQKDYLRCAELLRRTRNSQICLQSPTAANAWQYHLRALKILAWNKAELRDFFAQEQIPASYADSKWEFETLRQLRAEPTGPALGLLHCHLIPAYLHDQAG